MTTPPPPGASVSPDRLPELADTVLVGMLDRDPPTATYLGEHTRDGLLPDPSATAADARAVQIRGQLAELDAVAAGAPDRSVDDAVDIGVLRTVLAAELLDLTELHEAEWNPMEHNPGGALHALLSRDFAPLPDRLRSVTDRLTAVPAYLDAARGRLGEMSRVHLDTAVAQLAGTIALIDSELPAAVDAVSDQRSAAETVAAAARAALVEHRDWLAGRAAAAGRDPRIGADAFRAKLALTLDTAFEPEQLLRSAEADLERVQQELAVEAGRLAQVANPDRATVRSVLDELAADAPTDATVLGLCRDALAATTRFVRERELVTVFDDPVAVVEMPEIDRGVSVAYCRQNGPLEVADLPTEFAVAPTPRDWSVDEVASFYREYNVHMLQELAVHEAMPGHALQLMHGNRHRGRTPVRAVWWSGSFVEGWAVYAEQLMADEGYRGDDSPRAAAAVRMQRLKMLLRSIVNTILDIRFHCDDLDEAGAMSLMLEQGFQEHGEAAGKWRRVQLSSTQLCTYYVGYTEMRQIAEDLGRAHPEWTLRQRHDAMLAHGSPPPRHLRTLVGLPAADA